MPSPFQDGPIQRCRSRAPACYCRQEVLPCLLNSDSRRIKNKCLITTTSWFAFRLARYGRPTLPKKRQAEVESSLDLRTPISPLLHLVSQSMLVDRPLGCAPILGQKTPSKRDRRFGHYSLFCKQAREQNDKRGSCHLYWRVKKENFTYLVPITFAIRSHLPLRRSISSCKKTRRSSLFHWRSFLRSLTRFPAVIVAAASAMR